MYGTVAHGTSMTSGKQATTPISQLKLSVTYGILKQYDDLVFGLGGTGNLEGKECHVMGLQTK